ncbi:ankyrin repeat protein [Pandoravirus inopinatum]|uniref:Ankyrin repeat protein n=1 Tax=Pandoravirus inopinatum TaxID=1605721 RepID=A0A0B5IYP5_9VIRU|nr:ankyrin repeat protein [Pandoravirus inopinatum]AJF98008.1 ankyrin repeat protein [Pandoravirus inopinatum]
MAGLTDMPPEIIALILGHVSSLRDRVACVAASSLLAVEPLSRAAASLCPSTTIERFMEVGAPLDAIQYIGSRHHKRVLPKHVEAAACGGRRDVVEWVLEHAGLPAMHRCRPLDAYEEDPDSVDVGGKRKRKREPASYERIHRRWGVNAYSRQHAGPLVEALCESAHRGHVDVLDLLLDACALSANRDLDAALLDCLSVEATSAPGTATFDYLCRRRRRRGNGGSSGQARGRFRAHAPCCCPHAAYDAAVQDDRVDLVAWMHQAECDAAPHFSHPCHRSVYKSIRQGKMAVSRWLVDVLDVARWPEVDECLADALVKAAEHGHVDVLALVHGLGVQVCPLRALVCAAHAGHVEVLEWAAGTHDRGNAYGLMVGRSRPVAAWPSVAIGQAAAINGRTRTIQWLLQRSDVLKTLDVGAARAALRRGHYTIGNMLHEHGIAPYDQWDALGAAVASGKMDAIASVVNRGARCTSAALREAFCRSDEKIIAFLYTSFGDIQDPLSEAINALAGVEVELEPVAWILANADDQVCLAGLLAHSLLNGSSASCPCAQCRYPC